MADTSTARRPRGQIPVFLDPYFCTQDEYTYITAQQGSRFAKDIARDFNPIHDPSHRRFCVPGDLLFALALTRYGLSRSMAADFSDRVGADTLLSFPADEGSPISISDQHKHTYLTIDRSGETLQDEQVIARFVHAYVEFSGQTFPFILVPLMREAGVMFNPRRPFVVYARMSIDLDRTSLNVPRLTLADRRFNVNGRRGTADFVFDVLDGDHKIGRGTKTLLLSGLQPYDEDAMNEVVTQFYAARDTYLAEKNNN